VRSVFVSGPDNTVTLNHTYPKSTGRNFDEILRAIDSLQLTANHAVSTPVDWTKGERVVVPPTVSTDDAKQKYQNVEEVKPYLRYADDPSK
jgi:thioredoxin-dependent peroxiredoxin